MKTNLFTIDFITNTMTITKAFERRANRIGSEEYKMLAQIKKDFPTMQLVRKTHALTKRPNPYKGLTYAAMEQYIEATAAELLEEFWSVRETAKITPNAYLYVRNWFLKHFPEYMANSAYAAEAKIPTLDLAA